MSSHKVKGAVIAFLFLLVIFIATAPELPIVPEPNKTVKFVFATWDHPDQYGQGIDGFRLYENSTGSWEPAWFSWGYYVEHDDSEHEVFVWNASIFIMLRVWSTINATLVGASDADEGENYHRHNVTVTDRADVTVFEQQNFTYVNGVEGWLYEPFDDLLYYEYTIVLNFLPLPLEVYTVSVLYEVFW